jgi:hypothetical protein
MTPYEIVIPGQRCPSKKMRISGNLRSLSRRSGLRDSRNVVRVAKTLRNFNHLPLTFVSNMK